MDEEKTWSQRLIADLAEIHGVPDWGRWPQDSESNAFAVAYFREASVESVTVLFDAGLPEAGSGHFGHAQVEVGRCGVEIKVFTAYGDAPEGCKTHG